MGVINIKIYNLCYNVFNILDENISTNDDFSDKSEINININDPLINNIKRTNLSTNDEIICRYDISYTRYNHSKKLKYIFTINRILDKNGNIFFKTYINDKYDTSYINYYILKKIKWRLKIIFNNYHKYENILFLNILNNIDTGFMIERKLKDKKYINNSKININKNNIKEISISTQSKMVNNKLKSVSIIYEIIFIPDKVFSECSIIIKRNIYNNYQEIYLDNIFVKQSINNKLISAFKVINKEYEKNILKIVLKNIQSIIYNIYTAMD